jgi:hypothetical protein
MQAYSNPKRETEAHALQDVETFCIPSTPTGWVAGWYYRTTHDGVASVALGPFATEAEALADAQSGAGCECRVCGDNTAPAPDSLCDTCEALAHAATLGVSGAGEE